jgi:hypothetical protein
MLSHVVVGVGGCFGYCVNVSIQGNKINLSFGGVGLMEKSPYIGYSKLPISQRSQNSLFAQGGAGIVGAVSIGLSSCQRTICRGTLKTNDFELDIGPGGGAATGLQHTVSISIVKLLTFGLGG